MNTLGSVYEEGTLYNHQEIDETKMYETYRDLLSKLDIDPKTFVLSNSTDIKFDKISNSISSFGESVTLKSYKTELISNDFHLDIKLTLKNFFNDLIFEHPRGNDVRIIIVANTIVGLGIEVLPVFSIIHDDYTVTLEKPQLKITYAII